MERVQLFTLKIHERFRQSGNRPRNFPMNLLNDHLWNKFFSKKYFLVFQIKNFCHLFHNKMGIRLRGSFKNYVTKICGAIEKEKLEFEKCEGD